MKKKFIKLGFGTCQLGGVTKIGNKHIGMGIQRENDSIKALNLAYKNGIKFFDTADVYGNGSVEKLLGKVFFKKKVIICSKIGNKKIKNSFTFSFSEKYVIETLKKILKRIKKKTLSILLIHSPPKEFKLSENLFQFIKMLKKKKLIKHFGISFSTVSHAHDLLNNQRLSKNLDYIEIIYNILDRRADRIFKLSKKLNIKIIARMPYAYGFLVKKKFNFSTNDFRKKTDKDFIKWVKKSQKKLQKLNIPLAELSLRFFLNSKYLDYVIPGMRNENQVESNLSYFSKGKLNNKQLKFINNLPICFHKWENI